MSRFLAVVNIISPLGGGQPDNTLPGGLPGIDNSLPGGGGGWGGPVDPGFGVGLPVRPDQGLPVAPGRPAHPWIPPGGRPDQPIFLPPGIWPVPPGTPGGGLSPSHPIWLPEGGTKPVEPDEGTPDQGLPEGGGGEAPDQGLPSGGSPSHPIANASFAIIYSAPKGAWILITGSGVSGIGKPDQGLPGGGEGGETPPTTKPVPKPTPKR